MATWTLVSLYNICQESVTSNTTARMSSSFRSGQTSPCCVSGVCHDCVIVAGESLGRGSYCGCVLWEGSGNATCAFRIHRYTIWVQFQPTKKTLYKLLRLLRPYSSLLSSREMGFRCMKLQKPPRVHSLQMSRQHYHEFVSVTTHHLLATVTCFKWP